MSHRCLILDARDFSVRADGTSDNTAAMNGIRNEMRIF
jgi:hypothetical protein